MLQLNWLRKTILAVTLLAGSTAAGVVSAGDILVVGATGRTGRLVVAQLQAQNRGVKAFVRDTESAREKLGDDVELVVGDVRDIDSIREALDGVDSVISSIGRTKAPGNGPEEVDYGGVKNLAEASTEAGIEHVVLVSSKGVTDPDHFLNKMFDNLLTWKLKGENALRDSGVAYTIVRPGGLVDTPGGEKEIIFEQGDEGAGSIARADVAAVCIAALDTPEARNKTVAVVSGEGPQANDWSAMFGALPAE